MVISADIVKILSGKHGGETYVLIENAMEEFLKASEKRTPDMFLDALSLLFAVGLIERKEYRIKLVKHEKQTKQLALF